jgi:hypothetical protein
MGIFTEVYMSLMKNLHGKQLAGIILVVLFLVVVFGYGMREWRTSKEGYCVFGPNKKAPAMETCKAEKGDCPYRSSNTR